MVFKTAFIAHVPDADPVEHRCELETEFYKLYVRLISNQEEALQVCRKLAEKEGVQSILLCPGFTHTQIAEIAEVCGEDIGISVARSDGPGSRVAMEAMKKAGWFNK